MTTAAITGASGLVGGNLAALLVADGVRVRATRRKNTQTAHLADLPIEWVEADLDDGGGLTRAFAGADVVFHCAAIPTQTRRMRGPHMDANVRGTENVLAAVRAASATSPPRLVHVSSVVACAIAPDGGPDVTEADPWNFAEHGLIEAYAVTKHDAELRVLASGLDVVVVNPGLMFGPRDAKPSSGRLIEALHAGRIFGHTSGMTNAVDVRDVCRGMIAAWRIGRRGERYILGGVNLSYDALFQIICAELGVPAPGIGLPDVLVRLAGAAGDLAERIVDRELDLNSAVTAYSICRGYRFSSDKAKRELGYTVAPLPQAVKDAIAWFRGQGKL